MAASDENRKNFCLGLPRNGALKNSTERTICEINADDIQIVSVKPQQQATTQQVYNNDLTPF